MGINDDCGFNAIIFNFFIPYSFFFKQKPHFEESKGIQNIHMNTCVDGETFIFCGQPRIKSVTNS